MNANYGIWSIDFDSDDKICYFSLTNRITSILKTNISIKRDLPIAKASRIYTGDNLNQTKQISKKYFILVAIVSCNFIEIYELIT